MELKSIDSRLVKWNNIEDIMCTYLTLIKKMAFNVLFFLIVRIFVCSVIWSNISVAMADSDSSEVIVNVREGFLTVDVKQAHLIDILSIIIKEAGFKLIALDDLNCKVT